MFDYNRRQKKVRPENMRDRIRGSEGKIARYNIRYAKVAAFVSCFTCIINTKNKKNDSIRYRHLNKTVGKMCLWRELKELSVLMHFILFLNSDVLSNAGKHYDCKRTWKIRPLGLNRCTQINNNNFLKMRVVALDSILQRNVLRKSMNVVAYFSRATC